MAVTENKWMIRPVDKDRVVRERLKVVLKESNLSWAELARQNSCNKGALQRSIESKLGSVNDFFNRYGYEVVLKPLSDK
ncbi:MAG: hypothetical protein ACTHWQ_02005 [Sphingobacterium sp.]|uniref:hypothetical protein n=1 Tax=Sphingobacterium sp. JB170 TaxID=1434842 RepID=UPI000B3596CD|nr:hypothetical protein [Sphingobacterium sp. JB170]